MRSNGGVKTTARCADLLQEERESPVAKLRVLVAEDDPGIGRLLDVVMSGFGHQVTVTATSPDAMAAFDAGRFDVAILDVMLPGDEDGFGICRHIRRASPCAIVMLTARSSEGDHLLGYEAGADAYATKPFLPRELHQLVSDLAATPEDVRAKRRAEEQRKATFLRSLEHRF